MTACRTVALVVPALLASTIAGAAPLAVLAPAGEGMVIQRGVPVPLRGTASAGAAVEVAFDGERLETRADDAGRWRVVLAARVAGGPHELTVSAGGEAVRLRDVLVGDVWLCSGQSNMEWTLADSLGGAAEIAGADDPTIRHFKVPRSWSAAPQETLAGGRWEAASPATAGAFTGVGWFFARALRPQLDVPIGLVNSTWGGSRVEAWMAAGSLGLDDDAVATLLAEEAEHARQVLARIATRVGGLPDRDRGFEGDVAVWADPRLDDSAWETIPVPALWETVGWEGMDGTAWYRTAFELTAGQAAAGIELHLAPIDDSDVTWVNGHEVGRTDFQWNRPRTYTVPAAVLRPGRNVVAVRVEDTGGGGGIHGDPALLYVATDDGRIPLAGDWRFALGTIDLRLDDRKRDQPAMLYNRMIQPLHAYPIRGVLWYQGESNTGGEDASAYGALFRRLITDWRGAWVPGPGGPELPFLFAQIASFLPVAPEPTDSDWAVLRESQSTALALPATAQAVLLDAGEADDIHPRDKRTVGERLALAARAIAYGEDIVFSGPVYRSHEARAGALAIDFDHVGGGLMARRSTDGRVRGFAVAGADRRFHWAEARIEGNRVVVASEAVPRPVAVRYAWADNPEGADLYNREGLPAAPFRTDAWSRPAAPASAAPEER